MTWDMRHETLDMRHYTWDMRHETWKKYRSSINQPIIKTTVRKENKSDIPFTFFMHGLNPPMSQDKNLEPHLSIVSLKGVC